MVAGEQLRNTARCIPGPLYHWNNDDDFGKLVYNETKIGKSGVVF